MNLESRIIKNADFWNDLEHKLASIERVERIVVNLRYNMGYRVEQENLIKLLALFDVESGRLM